MWGIKIFVGLCVLLLTTDARPERYGIKGGGLAKSTANAVASSYASANAGAGGLGIAKSSATATAYSNGGGTSNADARAHASIDGGNIGKAITSDETNENANERDKTDELRQWDDHGHVGSYDDYGNLKPNAQHRDEHRCTPEGVKGHRSKTRCDENKPTQDGNSDQPDSQGSGTVNGGCGGNSPKPGPVGEGHSASPCGSSKCLGNKPSVSNPYPTYGKNPDLSTGSSNPGGIDVGNSPKPGTIDRGHSASPCGTGNSQCLGNKPSVSNPYPTYDQNPHLSTGSSNPGGIDIGNSPKPGTIDKGHSASPCGTGNSQCLGNKPSVSNPYPTYDQNPHLSTGSSNPGGIDIGNSPKPGTIDRGHSASPCGTGNSQCLGNKPSVSNPYPTYDQNPHLSTGSSNPGGIDVGNSPKPGTIDRGHSASSCGTGNSQCLGNKPSVSNPYPTYDQNPHLSTGSSNPGGIDIGNSPKPGTIDRGHSASPCGTGNSQCLGNKPSVSNPYPTYDRNPHQSTGSSNPGGIDIGNSPKPGTIDRGHSASPCGTGNSQCLGNKPSVSNPYPTYDRNPHQSTGSSNPGGIDIGNSPKPGTIDRGHSASPCGTGNSQCLGNKPSVSNPYPTYDQNPHLSTGSSNPGGIDVGNSPKPGKIDRGHSASPCGTGNSQCLGNKPSVSNPYPTYDQNPHLSTGSSNPGGIDIGNSPKPGTIDRGHSASPCGTGNSQCLGNKPSVAIPYPTYDKNPHSSADASSSVGIAQGYGENSPKPGTISGQHTTSPCASGDSKCLTHNPSVPKSYPTYNENPDTSESNSKYPVNFDGVYGAKHPTDADHNSGKKPGTSNPFLNGEVDLSGVKNPSNTGAHPSGKPNPSNPFLNPLSQVLPPTAANHPNIPSGTNGGSTTATHQNPQEGPSDIPHHSGNKPKPQNPFLTQHGKNPEASGSSQNEKIPNKNPWINNQPTMSCGGTSCSSKPSGNPSTNHHEKQPGHSNPSFDDDGYVEPTKPGSDDDNPNPKVVDDCESGFYSPKCDEGSDDSDWEDSENDEYGSQRGNQKFGVKGVGVKGRSNHRGPPIKLQGPSEFGDNGHSRYEHEDEGHSTGNGSSSAFSSAMAFSSSSGGVAKSSANARSEAFGSGSFASSSASASASSNSEFHHD